jgi:hypothetical protein
VYHIFGIAHRLVATLTAITSLAASRADEWSTRGPKNVCPAQVEALEKAVFTEAQFAADSMVRLSPFLVVVICVGARKNELVPFDLLASMTADLRNSFISS